MRLKKEKIFFIFGRLRWFNAKEPIKKLKLNTITVNIQYFPLML